MSNGLRLRALTNEQTHRHMDARNQFYYQRPGEKSEIMCFPSQDMCHKNFMGLRIPAMHEANTALLDILVDNSVIIVSFQKGFLSDLKMMVY